jgi:hypothetical protein
MRNEFAKCEIKTSVFSGRRSQAGNCCPNSQKLPRHGNHVGAYAGVVSQISPGAWEEKLTRLPRAVLCSHGQTPSHHSAVHAIHGFAVGHGQVSLPHHVRLRPCKTGALRMPRFGSSTRESHPARGSLAGNRRASDGCGAGPATGGREPNSSRRHHGATRP